MSQILTALLDSQDGYATTECDSTQVDSQLSPRFREDHEDHEDHGDENDAIAKIDVCSTDEDVDTTASEGTEDESKESAVKQWNQLSHLSAGIENCLRHLVGLEVFQSLHPSAPRIFPRQVEAICCLDALVSSGRYKAQQLGLFSREFSTTGCRNFLVDTHAGFALTASPQKWHGGAFLGRHLYEVLLENKPCWLYFDLEFSRVENPNHEPHVVAEAFVELLNQFCDLRFGQLIDRSTFYDLDSTNSEKFSKHIIVKKLISKFASSTNLAFHSNAQAGCFVKLFMEFVREQREAGDLLAKQLFVNAKPRKGKEMNAEREVVPVVDESVYTRNRCFRVLFSSKFGKRRPLLPTWGQPQHPARQLLDSLASFVPEGTTLFRHPLVPVACHQHIRVKRSGALEGSNLKAQLPKADVVEVSLSEHSALFRHLIELWDDCRQKNEPNHQAVGPTRVQRCLLMGEGNFMVVALANNRFCFKKGACHRSNGVYLVINRKRWVVYQKCHDVADCPDFRSHEFELPKVLRPEGVEEHCDDAMNQEDENQRDPISQELLTQIFDPETPKRHQRCASRSRSSSPKRWSKRLTRHSSGESQSERHCGELQHLPCRM